MAFRDSSSPAPARVRANIIVNQNFKKTVNLLSTQCVSIRIIIISSTTEDLTTPRSPALKAILSLMDDNNRRIIGLLQRNPELTQAELAKKIHISQSAIATRLKKLASAGLFVRGNGLTYEQLGLRMARADIETTDYENVLKWADSCPLFINASIGVGSRSISLFFVSEDLLMFHFIVNEHLRKMKNVRSLNFSEIVNWMKQFPISVSLESTKQSTPPCGMNPYCPKCPGNPDYSGAIWNYAAVKPN